jgi:hypothetical protein
MLRGVGLEHHNFQKIKTCRDNAFHLNSNRKILNNLIGCIS